jgi:endonuclease/exonuclease/phosphatase family metal-dependent hydrolase
MRDTLKIRREFLIMQQEVRFATFNTLNLAPCGARLYDGLEPSTAAQYEAKLVWTASQIDLIDADVIGFQEVFSQATLKEALARTVNYRHAHHVGFDPDPAAERLTPSVALVSRLPLSAPAISHPAFPAGVAMPPGSRDPDRFARAPLHAAVLLAPGCTVDVLVVHLKSQRPDYRNGDNGDDPALYAMACLRSLVRRGTEAVALRVLLCNLAQSGRARIVLGDFNDLADAITTGIVLGKGAPVGERMFDAYQIQAQADPLRHVAYTSVHEGHYATIDHILVSGHFNAALPGAIGQVLDVIYLNDHLALGREDASDHGQVVARIGLHAGDAS